MGVPQDVWGVEHILSCLDSNKLLGAVQQYSQLSRAFWASYSCRLLLGTHGSYWRSCMLHSWWILLGPHTATDSFLGLTSLKIECACMILWSYDQSLVLRRYWGGMYTPISIGVSQQCCTFSVIFFWPRKLTCSLMVCTGRNKPISKN
jgi:hypothetical protein